MAWWNAVLAIGGALIGSHNKKKQADKQNHYSNEMYELSKQYRDLERSGIGYQETQLGLDNELLYYQSDYINDTRDQVRIQLDLERAQLGLQGQGIDLQQQGLDIQETNLKARMGLYDNIMTQQQSMTEAVKDETMRMLNTEFEGMSIQKQQIEEQHQQQSAVRSIQALRERASMMVTTGEASVGGSSVQRAVFQLANDEAMQQAQMSSEAQNLISTLSVEARSKQMQAGNTISNALRQGLMSKMNMLNSKNGVISQLINNRQAKLGTYLEEAGLAITKNETELNFERRFNDLDLEQYKLGYQQDLNKITGEKIDDMYDKLELDAEGAKIKNKYGQTDYNFANMFAEVAPTAYYVGLNEDWW
jgi:hypothetical protein